MFRIDNQSRTPVFEQIVEQAEEYVRTGILNPGDKLPSIRELTSLIGVNPNTIQKAYNELDRRGVTISVAGKGCFISKNISEVMKSAAIGKLPEFERLAKELIDSGITEKELTDIIKKVSSNK